MFSLCLCSVPAVGFLASYIGSAIDVGAHQRTVPYNRINWNRGNGFDIRRHTFTAPVSGIYAIHVNALSHKKSACVKLLKNGIQQANQWSGYKDSNAHISVGLPLNKGDKVWVVACRHTDIDNDFGNSFSGYLVTTF